MALEGSLKEFNVADILQLIFFQKKTGVLVLNGRYDRVRVLFSEGNIVGAESKKRGFDRKLGMILMKKGLISREQIEATIEKQRAEGGRFGSVLVKEGYINKEDLQQVITFQITEVMVQVFSMKEGFYEFKPQSVPVDKEVGVVLNTEHFLMEGVRLVDEWSQIEGKIDLEDVFFQTGRSPSSPLTEEETRVLGFVDGKSSVADVTDISGIDSYRVSSSILGMVGKGVLRKYVEEKEEPKKAVSVKKEIPGLKAILYFIIFISLVLSGYVIAGSPEAKDYKVFKASEQLDSISFRLKSQFYLKGAYPASINDADPWGNLYLYEPKKDDFLLMSAGPDGYLDTKDDIPPIYGYFTESGPRLHYLPYDKKSAPEGQGG